MRMHVPLRPITCFQIAVVWFCFLGLISFALPPSIPIVPECMAQSTDRSTAAGGQTVTVNVGTGNLRAQPDINALVIDQLRSGTRLRLVERRHPWYQVELQDGRRGWVHASVLNLNAPTQPVPAPPSSRTQASMPPLHTHYTVKVETARVRKDPNLKSEIAFRLRQGDRVRVNGIQQDWFLIKAADGRSGWAHQRLFVPAANPGLDPSASPTVIKAVRHTRGPQNTEKVLFDLKGFHAPNTFTINGNRPRLVCDFQKARLEQGVKPRIPVSGNLIKDIRVAYHADPAAKVRVVLDLQPDRSYEVEQIYFRQESQFILILTSK